MPMMWGYYNDGMVWWMIVSSLFWLGLAAIVVWALVRWIGHATRTTPPHATQTPPSVHRSALDILNERYARGEIDSATYQSMRERLTEPQAAAADSPQQPEAIPSGR